MIVIRNLVLVHLIALVSATLQKHIVVYKSLCLRIFFSAANAAPA